MRRHDLAADLTTCAGLRRAGGQLVLAACGFLALALLPARASAQQFAQDSGEVPIGTFELQGQGLAVDPSPAAGQAPVSEDEDPSSLWFLQRFELNLRESKEARQAILDEAEGELKNGRAGRAQRLFERLIADAPETDEAKAARAHLADLYRPKREAPQTVNQVQDDMARNATRVSQAIDEQFLTTAGDRVFFAEGQADIGLRAQAVIRAQARFLKSKPELSAVIEGHADDAGVTDDQVQALGMSRAAAVRDVLISEGINARRLAIVSKGRDERVAPCDEGSCRAQNRRAVTVLMATGSGRAPMKSSRVEPTGSLSMQE